LHYQFTKNFNPIAMFELLTLAFLQFAAFTGQPATKVGGTGWGEDVARTSSSAVGGTGWGEDYTHSSAVGGTGWGEDVARTSSSAVGGTGWGED